MGFLRGKRLFWWMIKVPSIYIYTGGYDKRPPFLHLPSDRNFGLEMFLPSSLFSLPLTLFFVKENLFFFIFKKNLLFLVVCGSFFLFLLLIVFWRHRPFLKKKKKSLDIFKKSGREIEKKEDLTSLSFLSSSPLIFISMPFIFPKSSDFLIFYKKILSPKKPYLSWFPRYQYIFFKKK